MYGCMARYFFFFSSRRRHTRFDCDWSSDVCSSDLRVREHLLLALERPAILVHHRGKSRRDGRREVFRARAHRSEEHTSELQSQSNLVCRLLLEKKKIVLVGAGSADLPLPSGVLYVR